MSWTAFASASSTNGAWLEVRTRGFASCRSVTMSGLRDARVRLRLSSVHPATIARESALVQRPKAVSVAFSWATPTGRHKGRDDPPEPDGTQRKPLRRSLGPPARRQGAAPSSQVDSRPSINSRPIHLGSNPCHQVPDLRSQLPQLSRPEPPEPGFLSLPDTNRVPLVTAPVAAGRGLAAAGSSCSGASPFPSPAGRAARTEVRLSPEKKYSRRDSNARPTV